MISSIPISIISIVLSSISLGVVAFSWWIENEEKKILMRHSTEEAT